MRLNRRNSARATIAALVFSAGLLVAPTTAAANPWSNIDCEQFPEHSECQTETGTPAGPAWAVQPTGEVVCHNDSGEETDCYIEGQGWIGGDGCRYQRTASGPPPEGATEPGGWHLRQCTNPSGGSVVWLPESDAPGLGMLARTAASLLVLPPPEIEMSPPQSATQLVRLPTWLWVEPAWWSNRSASASVPGISVTVVARPTGVRWQTGDGAYYSCDEGTPYTEAADPTAASPDCGHVYTRPSTDQPGGVFQLSSTVTWQVSWSGGGGSGTLDTQFSTTTTSVEVVESLARNTRSRL